MAQVRQCTMLQCHWLSSREEEESCFSLNSLNKSIFFRKTSFEGTEEKSATSLEFRGESSQYLMDVHHLPWLARVCSRLWAVLQMSIVKPSWLCWDREGRPQARASRATWLACGSSPTHRLSHMLTQRWMDASSALRGENEALSCLSLSLSPPAVCWPCHSADA